MQTNRKQQQKQNCVYLRILQKKNISHLKLKSLKTEVKTKRSSH